MMMVGKTTVCVMTRFLCRTKLEKIANKSLEFIPIKCNFEDTLKAKLFGGAGGGINHLEPFIFIFQLIAFFSNSLLAPPPPPCVPSRPACDFIILEAVKELRSHTTPQL